MIQLVIYDKTNEPLKNERKCVAPDPVTCLFNFFGLVVLLSRQSIQCIVILRNYSNFCIKQFPYFTHHVFRVRNSIGINLGCLYFMVYGFPFTVLLV